MERKINRLKGHIKLNSLGLPLSQYIIFLYIHFNVNNIKNYYDSILVS